MSNRFDRNLDNDFKKGLLRLHLNNLYELDEQLRAMLDSTTVTTLRPLQLSIFHYFIEEVMVRNLKPILEGKGILRAKWKVFRLLGTKEAIKFNETYKRLVMSTAYLAEVAEDVDYAYHKFPVKVKGNGTSSIDGYAVSLNRIDYYMVYLTKGVTMVYPDGQTKAFRDFKIINFKNKDKEITDKEFTNVDGAVFLITEVSLEEEE
ncbi:hypothetical protein HOR18_gp170 [Staphylococcus phage vB_SscM-1]|uniref:Uncharacterized protein n=2 Tax=Sciuriunavirus SscM1 TaxID=2734053 RepID=A0A1X9I9W4_9CAUD|nr:hypothetical protein HOR18_gp170 [Staphylococcus phage vB_SscM-1]ANT44833.1 hypothetical protein vB_SscM-1_169 [Staphylococcus phage vB_SscM-1]ANT45035.1 hypothetical protein vB_SscM-2_168 [Staphylococcus phage vB_SscM-2]